MISHQAKQKGLHYTNTDLINLIQIAVDKVSWFSWDSCCLVLVDHVCCQDFKCAVIIKGFFKRKG